MKPIFFSLTVYALMQLAPHTIQAQTTLLAQDPNDTWTKSGTSVWQSSVDGTHTWFMVNKNGHMTSSTDNKTWNENDNGVWSDYDGVWYRINYETQNIESSKDNGLNWTADADRSWRGNNGTWYHFDPNWNMWTGGNTLTPPLYDPADDSNTNINNTTTSIPAVGNTTTTNNVNGSNTTNKSQSTGNNYNNNPEGTTGFPDNRNPGNFTNTNGTSGNGSTSNGGAGSSTGGGGNTYNPK